MVIKKIQIENYLCYYDTNTFELADGLNIILGENNEGKTKFFEAVEWLFNGENRNLALLVSAKKLHETETGESFRVSVSITVNQFGSNSTITKSFIAKKSDNNLCTTSKYKIEGIEVNKSSGERTPVDGKTLLDRIFPYQIRTYSMFKGEAELNIFESEKALTNLINLFSEAKHYNKYSEKGAYLRKIAEKAVKDSIDLDKNNKTLYDQLETDIISLGRQKYNIKTYLNTTENEIRTLEKYLEDAARHVQNADALETLNKRIKNIEDKISKLNLSIDENYTTSLFDDNWILVNFEQFQKDFGKKVTEHSKKRRELQSEYDKLKGVKEGEKKAKAELLNNSVPLPIGVPSKTYMKEMLKDEICKVCNREAPKDSEPYSFMLNKLKTYLESQKSADDVPEADDHLFLYDYTNRLEYLIISHEDNLKNLRSIKSNIRECFKFNDARKKDIEKLNDQLDKEKQERDRILGNSNLAEEKLIDVLKNYNAWQTDLKLRHQEKYDYTSKLKSIESELQSKRIEKDKIDTRSASSFLVKTREILRDIEIIFNQTKEKKFDEFIKKLEDKSNSFFNIINIEAFTGKIVFYKKEVGDTVTIEVSLEEEGQLYYEPGTAVKTSMYISILFAIAELASETREEKFPLIFDAPTSSFGTNKTAQFLNLIAVTDNQKILLIKDFLHTDKETKSLTIKKEFESVKRDKAFWVKLERPFDRYKLNTINTQVITL